MLHTKHSFPLPPPQSIPHSLLPKDRSPRESQPNLAHEVEAGTNPSSLQQGWTIGKGLQRTSSWASKSWSYCQGPITDQVEKKTSHWGGSSVSLRSLLFYCLYSSRIFFTRFSFLLWPAPVPHVYLISLIEKIHSTNGTCVAAKMGKLTPRLSRLFSYMKIILHYTLLFGVLIFGR